MQNSIRIDTSSIPGSDLTALAQTILETACRLLDNREVMAEFEEWIRQGGCNKYNA